MRRMLIVGAVAAALCAAYFAGASASQLITHTLRVNGALLTPDVPAIYADGRVFVPVRWISEALGASVSPGQGHSVDINTVGAGGLEVASDYLGNNVMTGYVENKGVSTAYHVGVQVVFWDAQGNAVNTYQGAVSPSTLAPGTEGSFSLSISPSNQAVALEVIPTKQATIGDTLTYLDTADVNNGQQQAIPIQVTVTKAWETSQIPTSYGTVDTPGSGNSYLVLSLTFRNATGYPVDICPGDWSYVTDSTGQRYHVSSDTNDLPDGIACPSNPLLPGQYLSGEVAYQIPSTDSSVQFWYGSSTTDSYAEVNIPVTSTQ